MYLGRVVETGAADELFSTPRHPYTAVLMSAVPRMTDEGVARKRITVGGDVPSPVAPPPACVFHPRCPRAQPGTCDVDRPELAPRPGRVAHDVACHFPLERWPMTEDEMRVPADVARPASS